MRQIISEFRGSISKFALLAGVPGDVQIKDCFGRRSSAPPDCVGEVSSDWTQMASVEQDVAKELGGVWIDSRPWFCSSQEVCPSFVGTTPTKGDEFHVTPAYGEKIHPVMHESFAAAGVF